MYEKYVRTGVKRMQNLIQDLLQFSRVVREEDETEDLADLNAVLNRVVDNMKPMIESANGTITRDPLPIVRGDEVLLEQLFRNLFSNSLKYRKPDVAPQIHVGAKRNGRTWTLSTRDNGIGFDPKFAERIFVLFQRLHGQEYSGTGVGLAICKRIVEKCGGRIWAESMPDAGATFYFTLTDADGEVQGAGGSERSSES